MFMQRYHSNSPRWDFLRSHCVPMLELWHTYKQASLMIWKNTSLFTSVWAPFQHHLSPEGTIYQGVKLSRACLFLTAARKAWKSVGHSFKQEIKASDGDFGTPMPDYIKGHCDNIIEAMERYIPVVSIHLLLCKLCMLLL